MEKKLTPLMKQYWEVKSQHQDKILFFRMGDFYEMFHKDAEVAAPILNIALTYRNKKAKDETKMCGMPHHSIAGALAKLLAAGHKVALCDQVEDPKKAKGLVKRAVTRILSPGMVYDPETLDELNANYICSYDDKTMAFYDSSTGEAFYYLLNKTQKAKSLLSILNPVEIVLSGEGKTKEFSDLGMHYHITAHDINDTFKGLEEPAAVLRLKSYAQYMAGGKEVNLHFEVKNLNQNMNLSPNTLRHLEIFKTYQGELKGSLFLAINRCKTSSGSRLLKKWLSFPLLDKKEINSRLDTVSFWAEKTSSLKAVRKILSAVGDVERRLSKVSQSHSGPRDLLSLIQSLKSGLAALNLEKLNNDFKDQESVLAPLILKSESMIVDEPPVSAAKGGVIQKGYNKELDELIKVTDHGQKMLAEMEASERSKTGISNLKIKYNNVFGYFIEVTNSHKDKVPSHYTRKQTLTNAERYLTGELKELEEKILSGKTKRLELEQKMFTDLRLEFINLSKEILYVSRVWSELDLLSSFAWLAIEQNYSRPNFTESGEILIKKSRHPVIEQELSEPFVANDIFLNKGECLLLTGPNMAGKSTIMRQVAISALMAQIGCYVPASDSQLPVYDQIFTRIGASDSLTEGLSTFMVEMKETSEILQACTENSLIIMDEVGRGTSTFDGMSLAQSILEYILNKGQAPHCLFATHYHELTALENKFKPVKNVHMAIKDKKGTLQFLYQLMLGPANKSYGIQVAKLAGLPVAVVRRAEALLKSFESGDQGSFAGDLPLLSFQSEDIPEDSFDAKTENEVLLLEEIKKISLGEVTPIEALNKIASWQQNLS